MQKYYKFQFKAFLDQLVLALKLSCEVEVIWKRGQKVVDTGKIKLTNGTATFQKELKIQSTMIFNTALCTFKQKITKFSILLYSEKGTKQAGQVQFDVSNYLNQKCSAPKKYQLRLNKCPDKNARISFSLSGYVLQEVTSDNLSLSSSYSLSIENIISQKQLQKQILPIKDYNRSMKNIGQEQPKLEIKSFQSQNRRIRQQLKGKQKLLMQIDEIKKKLKNEQFESVKQIKNKLEVGKKQFDNLKQNAKKIKNVEIQIKIIEQEIFKCKFQIMNAFNYAFEVGGGQLVDEMQENCGFKQKEN